MAKSKGGKGARSPRTFGEFVRARRGEMGLTLRAFCFKGGLDPGNYSKMERDHLPPPRNPRKLERFARLLSLKKGSADWRTFFDLAAVATGRLPREILKDEELVAKLPLLFRTLRGEKVPDPRLAALVRLLRKA